ncbi:MAG: hypothetical protein Q8S73_20325 [Deltaproteobacteria bacterium]|nr:hypothetical protein [Myxococcales bacterium]MDP3216466.1 hypothetical protein [Deltaproteobacteria bacterium]
MLTRLFKRGSTGPVRVRRGRVECALSAMAGVRGGQSLHRWLVLRLARHTAQAPVEEIPMSVTPVIEDGSYAEKRGPHPDYVWDRARVDPAGEWEPDEAGNFGVQVRATRAMLQAKGERLNRDRAAMQSDLSRLRAETMEIRDRRSDAIFAAQEAIGHGLTVPEGALARTPDERGRPAPLPRWPLLALSAVAVVGLVAEGTSLLSVFANANGIVPADLAQTWVDAPMVVASCGIQAVCATGAMLFCLEGARHLWARCFRGEARGWGAVAHGVGIFAMLGIYVAVGAVAAALRHQLQSATGGAAGDLGWAHGPLGMAVLTWAYPLIAAGAIEMARAYGDRCDARDEEVARWNAAEEQRRLRVDRDGALLASLEREAARLEAGTQAAEERLRALEAEAEALQESLRARAAAWRTTEGAWQNALRGAIAEDTVVFGWVAAWLKRPDLLLGAEPGTGGRLDGDESGSRQAVGLLPARR